MIVDELSFVIFGVIWLEGSLSLFVKKLKLLGSKYPIFSVHFYFNYNTFQATFHALLHNPPKLYGLLVLDASVTNESYLAEYLFWLLSIF